MRCEHCLWATASQSPSAAPSTPLRGPSRRNDAETVVGHLMAFREDPTLLKERDAYTALSRVVVEVAAAKHPEEGLFAYRGNTQGRTIGSENDMREGRAWRGCLGS